MRLLTVPNWSFGRNQTLLRRFERTLSRPDIHLHYLQGDVDHNRTVSAFSGEEGPLVEALMELCDFAFETIDLNKHVGVHPRIGALDVCPFLPMPDSESGHSAFLAANAAAERVAATIAGKYQIPVFLYEKSERGRHEADLPALRKGGFGSLLEKTLHPDFGPQFAHPQLGVTVVGVRDFLLAINVNLDDENASIARDLAKSIRDLRQEGDPRFLGVRALGLPLASRRQTQVSMNLTLPDLTPVDPIIEWIINEAAKLSIGAASTELIGVIRERDLPGATRLTVREDQVVDLTRRDA